MVLALDAEEVSVRRRPKEFQSILLPTHSRPANSRTAPLILAIERREAAACSKAAGRSGGATAAEMAGPPEPDWAGTARPAASGSAAVTGRSALTSASNR